jgi:hypothetical protein
MHFLHFGELRMLFFQSLQFTIWIIYETFLGVGRLVIVFASWNIKKPAFLTVGLKKITYWIVRLSYIYVPCIRDLSEVFDSNMGVYPLPSHATRVESGLVECSLSKPSTLFWNIFGKVKTCLGKVIRIESSLMKAGRVEYSPVVSSWKQCGRVETCRV